MSFDLFLWDPPRGEADDESVRARYERACEGLEDDDDDAAGESPRVNAFFEELLARFPHLDRILESEVDASPWSCGPERGDRWVSLTIRWGESGDEVVALVGALAEKHRVLLYDPQGDEVTRVTDRLRAREPDEVVGF